MLLISWHLCNQRQPHYHPNRSDNPEAEAKFKEINEANDVLSDPQKRAKYDQFGHAAFEGGAGQSISL